MVATVRRNFCRLARMMNEKLRRRWAACEAMALGRGGVTAVAQATGLSRTTIHHGIAEIKERMPHVTEAMEEGRVRRPGAGRPRRADQDKTLVRDLEKLLEPVTRGDPISHLLWTSKSTSKLTRELQDRGHQVSQMTVYRLLQDRGYSLQANRKTKEGTSSPDRDAQFQHINRKIRGFSRRGEPVISVDTKKRELVGDFKNAGREWRPKGKPEEVRMHDFRDEDLGVAIPYGVYDVGRNDGWVSVGIDHDTAEFAVATIRRWWQRMGKRVYPRAKELLITADAGGSNGSRCRLWKLGLQELADETGLTISVCHLPPGTSKWNKIEHRMFCHITENWRGQPLVSHGVIVNLIGHTTTTKGLRIKSAIDRGSYDQGIRVSNDEFATIDLRPDHFHGEWNYAISPRARRRHK